MVLGFIVVLDGNCGEAMKATQAHKTVDSVLSIGWGYNGEIMKNGIELGPGGISQNLSNFLNIHVRCLQEMYGE